MDGLWLANCYCFCTKLFGFYWLFSINFCSLFKVVKMIGYNPPFSSFYNLTWDYHFYVKKKQKKAIICAFNINFSIAKIDNSPFLCVIYYFYATPWLAK